MMNHKLLFALALASSLAFATPEEDYEKGVKANAMGDIVYALEWFRKAADAGHPGAQVDYGFLMNQSGEGELAVGYYRKAAEQEFPEGLYMLGVAYAAGEGILRDRQVAQQWIWKAAEKGHSKSKILLGESLIEGELAFTPEDLTSEKGKTAIAWAAEEKSPKVLQWQASAYRAGAFGYAKDIVKAKELEKQVRQLLGIAEETKRKKRN